jgi:hypothetical protein
MMYHGKTMLSRNLSYVSSSRIHKNTYVLGNNNGKENTSAPNRSVTKLLGALQTFTIHSEAYASPWPIMLNITYTQQIQWRACRVLK